MKTSQALSWPLLRKQDELFLFSSLMLVTACFLPWRGLADTERSPWQFMVQAGSLPAAFLWTMVLAVALTTPLTVLTPAARPWLGILAALVVNGALMFSFLMGQIAYGAVLAQLLAFTILFSSAKPALLAASDLTMRKLNSRRAEVFTHWGTVLNGIHFSAQEFYAKIETAVREREWPGVEIVRVAHREVGILSHKREYLRIVRQRQVIDICASTFGRDYFFTMREAEIVAQLTITTLLAFAVALLLLLFWMIASFGLLSGGIAYGTIAVVAFFLLFNVLRMGLTRVDGFLVRLPVLGPVYETFFRGSTTYFQHDTRVVFLKMMDEVVKGQVSEETSAKGVQMLSCFEHQPILDGVYKSSVLPLRAEA